MRLSVPILLREAEEPAPHLLVPPLTSGGTGRAVCVVWTGGRPEARSGPTPDKHEPPDLSANFRARVLLIF